MLHRRLKTGITPIGGRVCTVPAQAAANVKAVGSVSTLSGRDENVTRLSPGRPPSRDQHPNSTSSCYTKVTQGASIVHAMKKNGFSLLELMVTLAVASIVLSVGVPSFRAVIMDNRLASQANQFVTSVNMARSAAVRYQRNATVCASANYDAAVPTCAATTDWSNGWIVWVDKDRDAATDANEIISVYGPLHTSSTFTSTGLGAFTYNARGFGVAGGDDLTMCDDRTGETGRMIRVNNVGRTNVSRQGCG